jgi:hypothetical protein
MTATSMSQQDMKTLTGHTDMKRVGRSTISNLYHLLRKVEDIVPQQLWECTPVEIRCWVVEAGSGDEWRTCSVHVTVEQNKPMALVMGS